MGFELVFKNEVVDRVDSIEEAEYLKKEYQMAFRNPLVMIREASCCAMCDKVPTIEVFYSSNSYLVCEECMEHTAESLDRDSIRFKYRKLGQLTWYGDLAE